MINDKYILQIAPTPFFADRGCHIRIEGVVRCLTQLGYQNTVCTYHHGRDIQGINTQRISTIKNYTNTAAGPSRHKLWADWKLLWLTIKHYRKRRPAVIHAHLHEGIMIGMIVKTLFFWHRTPLIADMQGSLTGELESHGLFRKKPFLRWPVKTIERLLMWYADYIVCSSTHSKKIISEEFNLANSKISLVQDGANPASLVAIEKRAMLTQKLNLPTEKFVVVYSGAMLDAKGLAQLKDIILACKPHDEIHFLLIGYPIENITPFLIEHDLEKRCTLTGQVNFEELTDYLFLADVAIDPKNTDAGEGSGKMLNYLACGLPVVAFKTPNNANFLPNNTPLANSVNEIVTQLSTLKANPVLYSDTSKANLKQFEQYYSWSVTKQQLNAAYSIVLNDPI